MMQANARMPTATPRPTEESTGFFVLNDTSEMQRHEVRLTKLKAKSCYTLKNTVFFQPNFGSNMDKYV